MGYSVYWLAVKNEKSDALLQRLQLAVTGETDDCGESLFTGASLSSGWWVLFINRCGHAFVKPASLESISADGEVVACSIEEHVMWSRAEFWKGGAQVWSLEHDAQEGLGHLSMSGILPEGFAAIKAELFAEQGRAGGTDADSDFIFDIPPRTAKSIVGFKHDEPAPGETHFRVLTSIISEPSDDAAAGQPKKPQWKFW